MFCRSSGRSRLSREQLIQVAGYVLVSGSTLLVEAGLASSRGEARRLIAQRAVDVDGVTVTGDDWKIASGYIVKVGKRKFTRIVLTE